MAFNTSICGVKKY